MLNLLYLLFKFSDFILYINATIYLFICLFVYLFIYLLMQRICSIHCRLCKTVMTEKALSLGYMINFNY